MRSPADYLTGPRQPGKQRAAADQSVCIGTHSRRLTGNAPGTRIPAPGRYGVLVQPAGSASTVGSLIAKRASTLA